MARDFKFLGYAQAPEGGPYSVPVWSKEEAESNGYEITVNTDGTIAYFQNTTTECSIEILPPKQIE